MNSTHGTRHRTGRTKVKSGCRTCKIRKIKCDEGRPACRRCVSTGRLCDGYGIWGGGGWGKTPGHRQQQQIGSGDSALLPRPPAPISAVLALSSSACSDVQVHFEWFTYRTATKLPGTFVSSFWNILLFQASMQEPAILHAVLALSSTHQGYCGRRTGIAGTSDPAHPAAANAMSTGSSHRPEGRQHDQLTLQHYVKATSHLQPHFTKERSSVRVVLIACVVFVCLDFLRGHFQTAQAHLQYGLRILKDMGMLSSSSDFCHGKDNGRRNEMDKSGGGGILRPKKSFRDPADDWIVQAFSRLHLQIELFKYVHRHQCLVPVLTTFAAESESPGSLELRSTNEAWQHLERLMSRIFDLTHQARSQAGGKSLLKEATPKLESARRSSLALTRQQQLIHMKLAHWLDAYEIFLKTPRPLLSQGHGSGTDSRIERKTQQLIRIYHTMATIMAATCLRPGDESVYDTQTNRFVLLITQLAGLWVVSSSPPPSPPRHMPNGLPPNRNLPDLSNSVSDVGWIPPLYYTAIKCRVHRIRLQAIRLLQYTTHREGMWDASTSVCVARKVMELEEGGFYRYHHCSSSEEKGDIWCDVDDEFPATSSPRPQDLSMPTLPESRRLREVEMVLSGSPMDRVLLFCRRKRENGVDHRVLLSEYDVCLRRWIDHEDLSSGT